MKEGEKRRKNKVLVGELMRRKMKGTEGRRVYLRRR
jgi:hypothetical protein